MDCGPACLKMVAKYHGKDVSIKYLRQQSSIGKNGVSYDGLSEAAETIGLKTIPVLLPFETLEKEVPLPCIAHWNQNHFIVVYEISKNSVTVGDPELGIIVHAKEKFKKGWTGMEDRNKEGHLLLLEPSPDFNITEGQPARNDKGFSYLLGYFKDYKKQIREVFLGMLFGSLLQLVFPFLTQAVVDYGINLQDLNFVYLILIAQVVIFLSRSSVELIRGWILLHLTRKVNIRLISDFLVKLMSLPISFFESKHSGDIIQRINDNRKVQAFLSSSSLSTFFGFFNILIFALVLLYYSWAIFLIFMLGSVLYVFWSLQFFKQRAEYDHELFKLASNNQRGLFQLTSGIEEIKLNGSQRKRRWEWEAIQVKLFKLSTKSLKLEQKQSFGGSVINELKNIVITFIAAKLVITGSMTLGMMLAVQYILGQLNLPLNQLIDFLRTAQDAKLSLSRLTEVNLEQEEEEKKNTFVTELAEGGIQCMNLSFRYGPKSTPLTLKGITMELPKGKTTALVGVSGSGKTTLLKLLLKYYDTYSGSISVTNEDLKDISPAYWRSICGAVLQNGFIFSDSILSNICESEKDTEINSAMFHKAIEVANLGKFIKGLPNGYNTIIGDSGIAISGGEKQRILIARAIYKNPTYMFFDEATSSLDAENERVIMERLMDFYENKTVLIIAHRLSTVKNADNILVLDDGQIVEQGSHLELINKRGYYHSLVKNQLELGN